MEATGGHYVLASRGGWLYRKYKGTISPILANGATESLKLKECGEDEMVELFRADLCQ